MEIKYSKTCQYMGRNGTGKQTGLVIDDYTDKLVLGPVNSKGDPANCWIEVPVADLDTLIAELQALKLKRDNAKVPCTSG